MGVGEIRIKDESQRFGFGAFKALGGVLGVFGALRSSVGEAYHRSPTFEEVMKGEHREVTGRFVFPPRARAITAARWRRAPSCSAIAA